MDKVKKIIVFSFCIALYMSYYAGLTLFSHSHIINGATIIHSHIHADSHHNTNSGGHTKQSTTLIAQISQFEYVDFSCDCIINPPQLSLHEDKFVETTHWEASIHLENPSLRAPPALI